MKKMKKKMGLKKAVLLTVSAVTSITLLCVSLIGYLVSFNKVKNTLTVETEQALLANAEKMDAWLGAQGVFAADQANAAGVLNGLHPDHSKDIAFVKSLIPLNSEILDCYTTYEDVTIFMANFDASELPEGFNATTRDWYISAKTQNKAIYSSPYIHAAMATRSQT